MEKEKSEQKSPHQKRKEVLFERQERNISFGSADSDMIQDRHGWALDGLTEKEANMNKEIINPSVEHEEVVKIIDELRNDRQSRDLEENEVMTMFRMNGQIDPFTTS